MIRLNLSLVVACVSAAPVGAQLDGIERPPINYKTAQAENAVTALQKKIDAGQVKLKFTDDHGYLPALLKELNVPQSSQVLVFSKTSFQRDRIDPHRPRALYFNISHWTFVIRAVPYGIAYAQRSWNQPRISLWVTRSRA